MVVGIKENKQKELWQFLNHMKTEMSVGNTDGLGLAVMTQKGLYLERWLNNHQAFNYRKPWTSKDDKFKANFEGALEADAVYTGIAEKKGVFGHPAVSVIMHTRNASGEVALKNVHPFYREGTALIHNGFINNHEKLTKKYSTCDSETILNSYIDNKINEKPDNIKKLGEDVRGWYGCGVLTRTPEGKPILDIFRATNPYLHSTYIDELDAIVFCTSPYNVVEACKRLGWNHGNFLTLKQETMLRVDCITGNKISAHKFESKSGYWEGNLSVSYGSYGEWMSERDKEDLKNEVLEQTKQNQQSIEEARAGVTSNEEKKRPESVTTLNAKRMELDTLKRLSTLALGNNDPFLTSRMSLRH